MRSDVLASRKTSSGAVTSQRGRVHSIQYVASGTAGTIALKNGGSGGTTLVEIATPALATETGTVDFPLSGVLFASDVYATLTNVTSVTVFYTT